MIQVNDAYITADISEIMQELKSQLQINGHQLFYKFTDTTDNYMVCCPIHKNGQEHKPSMGIHKKTGVCHCFACDWVGSLAELISLCFGYADFGAFGKKWLVKNFLTLEVENRKELEIDLNRKPVQKSINYVSEQELDSYRYYHPYMYERRLTNEIIEKFDIGFDKKSDCITFPIRDISGGTIFVARRSVKSKFFNYPSGVEKPLYGLYELYKVSSDGIANSSTHILGYPYSFPKEVIICESMLDALTCWVYCKPAVALNGLGNELQFKQLRELPCRKLILATDNDERGMEARDRIQKNVPNKIITQYIIPQIKRPDGKVTKDINDLELDEFDNLKEIFI